MNRNIRAQAPAVRGAREAALVLHIRIFTGQIREDRIPRAYAVPEHVREYAVLRLLRLVIENTERHRVASKSF